MKKSHFAFSTLIITFLTLSISLYAASNADADISNIGDLQSVEKPIDSMTESELKDKQADLLAEEKELVALVATTQSPSALKSIIERLGQITKELNAVQQALALATSAAVISNITDDGYNDNVPPVITLNGNSTVTVELGTSYSDAGATANDAFHGSTPVVSSGSVDVNTVGSYIITYTATDLDGNTATATRTVNVVDTTAPVVTVTGDNPATVELGASYTDAGATASDASGDVSVVASGSVETSIV